ncbi:ABC transporter transmembrane domain-containing protein [Fontisubflavum oceani]|uniref:ABC transporter transmembrane domain-containing protein n=1 Tax=Fontisubflavum oceani TaxID=2978973 RepID=UPI0025B3B46A|nr:ABC transporter transmembrane domain-containing protein [Fontisubflavum oceani]WJY21738.1 ABC transporter transmembrane domain-containing protein [Fontisubflavum oceani]
MSQLPTCGAFARVLAFAASRWARRPGLLSIIIGLQIVSTGADVSIPILTGRLVAAVADGATPWAAFWGLMALGVLSIAAKIVSYFAIIDLTIPTMREVEAEAFARVQRLPASWHANAFAGSTARKITRGAWALDDMGDLLLLALGPAVLVLIGTIATLTAFRIEVGLVALAGATIFLAISLALTLKWVAPAARLANAQDRSCGPIDFH